MAIFGRSTSSNVAGDAALLLARLGLGLVLIAHGWQKFFTTGIDQVAAGFGELNIPLPTVAAWFAGLVELGGGALLVLGLVTQIVGLLVAIDMVGAFVFVHVGNGVFVEERGYELVLVIGVLGLLFAALGAGNFALDRMFGRNRARVGAR